MLVLTTFDFDGYGIEALSAGASGFLLKSSPRQHLLHAVRTVCGGGALLDPALTVRLVEEHVLGRTAADPATEQQLGRLTTREREVLELLARGYSNPEIALRLHLGERTVKSHVAHTLAKIGARDRIQAVVFTYEAGFVRPGELSHLRPGRHSTLPDILRSWKRRSVSQASSSDSARSRRSTASTCK